MAYQLSKSTGARPSTLFEVHDPVQAFCFDRAVMRFGDSLQNELDSVNEKTASGTKAKRQRILRKWIPEATAGFRDPARTGI